MIEAELERINKELKETMKILEKINKELRSLVDLIKIANRIR